MYGVRNNGIGTCKTHKSHSEMNVFGHYLNVLNFGVFRILR